jgi:predicted RNA-binding protein with PIN domain
MEIIIDGYNLIGSERGLVGALEHKRNWLVHQLSVYRQLKGLEIVLVFDGWRSGSGNETAQKTAGVTVIFSRQGEKADAVVIRLARSKGSGCVVVSSDREVAKTVEKFGVVAISAGAFGEILRRAGAPGSGDYDAFEPDPREEKKGNARRLGKLDKKRLETIRKLRV